MSNDRPSSTTMNTQATGPDPRGSTDAAFDREARARYGVATDSLTPSLQGRLRAARRDALAGGEGRRRDRSHKTLMPLAATAAAVFALAVGLRMQDPQNQAPPDSETSRPVADAGPPATSMPTPDIAPLPAPFVEGEVAIAAEDMPVLVLEEDPDFYLWLGGDESLPTLLEQDHDPT